MMQPILGNSVPCNLVTASSRLRPKFGLPRARHSDAFIQEGKSSLKVGGGLDRLMVTYATRTHFLLQA